MQPTTAMTRWDDLADDVQTVISACVRTNLLAELSEEELRLSDLENDFHALSRELGRSRRSYGAQLDLFKMSRRPNDVELQEVRIYRQMHCRGVQIQIHITTGTQEDSEWLA